MFKNNEAGRSGMRSGSNQIEFTGGKLNGFDAVNFTLDTEKLQQDLTEHLLQNRKVRKLVRCLGCNNPKSPLKFSKHSALCRDCVKELQTKGPVARNNFIERAKSNVGRFLKGVVANYA